MSKTESVLFCHPDCIGLRFALKADNIAKLSFGNESNSDTQGGSKERVDVSPDLSIFS